MNPLPNPPTTKGFSWTTFPWVLLLLGTLLLVSQLLNPGQGQQQALSWYTGSGLKQLEWDNYLSWLRFNGQAHQARSLEQQLAAGNEHAYAAALLEPQFQADSDKRATDFWSPADAEQWRQLRQQAPEQLAQSPLYRWGLPAMAPRASRFFTAPFTGGPLWLTLVALLTVGLVAWRLERRLGHGRILVIWLAGSLLSGAGYLMVAGPGMMPLHGAAPALLALLGAAAVVAREPVRITLPRGKQGPLTLTLPTWTPALLPLALLPALALTEPMLATLSAGLFSLFAGALLAVLIQPGTATESTREETAGPALTPEQQHFLGQGWDAIGKLDGDNAVRHFRQALDSDPQLFDALTGLFIGQQIQRPLPEDWHQTAAALFEHPAREAGQATQIAQLWKQYRQHNPGPLPEAVIWQLVMTLTRAGEFKQAEQLSTAHADKAEDLQRRQTAIDTLRQALLKEGLNHRAKALPA